MQPVRHNGRVSGEVKIVEAAGAVLYRRNTDFQGWMKFSDDGRQTSAASRLADFDTLEVCIVHRPKSRRLELGRKASWNSTRPTAHAAVREVSEETGVPVALGPFLGEIEYPLAEEGKKPAVPRIEPSTRSTFSSGWQGRSTPRTPCGGPTRSARCSR